MRVRKRSRDRAVGYIRQFAEVQAAGIDPESALRRACLRLREHVLRAEGLAGDTALSDLDDAERERIWQMAAADERQVEGS